MAEAKAYKMIPHCTKDTITYEMDELVLCKDCKFAAPDMVCGHESEWGNEDTRNHLDPNFFCADGKRRE